MKLPTFNRLNQLKSKIISFILSHRILILVSIVIIISMVGFVAAAIKLRNNLIANMKSFQKDSSDEANYVITPVLLSPTPDNLPSSDSSVLGLSSDESSTSEENNYTYSMPTLFPVITLVPLPTIVPQSTTTSTSSSTSSCAGKPTADNSQVYLSSKTTLVNSAVTVSVELRDCNNNFASDDSLTISLSNSDSSARINGSSPPVTIKAQGGKASFTVNSQNATTDTFVITDTSNSFTVTTPGYHNPSVTFTNNSSGNAHCNTGDGVPNSWFSDVYISSVTGTSARFTVKIRDCSQNLVSNDSLSISLSSGDPSVQVNGNNLPYPINVQNGEIGFTVTTQSAGTDTFIVQDTTSSFRVTPPGNPNDPSVTFSGPTASAPTDTPVSTVTDTPVSVPTDVPTTISPSSSPAPSSP